LGIGAFFSGEAASETSQGKMVVGFIIILGLAAIYGGVTANQKASTKAQQAPQATQVTQFPQAAQFSQAMEIPPPPPDAVAAGFCPYCGREIQADFVVCPFCGKSTKSMCPKCGKQVQKDFVACPYCGTVLKGA